MASRRMVLVHAHPDDETITTGATMAHYAGAGAQVTLITCTLGEQGEILVPEFAGLEAAQADQLGGLRIGELAEAMRALGVSDHRFLGGAGRFRDSGMAGDPANGAARAFWRADTDPDVFTAAVSAAAQVIREVRPQVLVTYDENGDYGHPDHVMAHRVAMAAVRAAADPAHGDPWQVAKVYWTATPRSVLHEGYAAVAAARELPYDAVPPEQLGFGVDDAMVTSVVDAEGSRAAKRAALAAHRTQILLDGDFFALSNNIGREIRGTEYYRLVQGPPGPLGADGLEHDLFAGVA